MFKGFFSYGGGEVGNAARVQSYARRIVPQLGLVSQPVFDQYEQVSGDVYTTPAADEAPWYSPQNPDSARFYGFYPTAFDGAEDSSASPVITELTSDGSVAALTRSASREMRVRGFIVAADGAALTAGKDWVRGAMAGSGCEEDECEGASLGFLSYLPDYCDYSLTPAVPVDATPGPGNPAGWVIYRRGQIAATAAGLQVTMPCGSDGAQRPVSGLIPGQAYRASLVMSSTAKLVLEVAGVSAVEAVREPSMDGTRTTWVIDFRAVSDTATIRVTLAGDECLNRTAQIRRLTIRRTASELAASIPRFSPDAIREPGSWAFQAPPAGVEVSTKLQPDPDVVESLTFEWRNGSGSAVNVGPAHPVRRIVRALVPGRPYVAYVKASSTHSTPSLAVQGVSGAFAAMGDGWYSYSFKATAPQHLIEVSFGADVTLANTEEASILLTYLRVDLDDSDLDLPAPDLLRPARRHYYQVSVVGGPTFEDIPMKVGAAAMVEVYFRANHPFAYTDRDDIRPDPGATVALIPDVTCLNGAPVRYNYYTDPRFANGTLGALPVGGLSSALIWWNMPWVEGAGANAVVAAPGGVFPDQRSAVITATSADPEASYVELPTASLKVGHTYTISADIGMTAAQTGTQSDRARRIVMTDSAGTRMSEQHPNRAGVTRVAVTFTYTSDFESIRIYHGGAVGEPDVAVSAILFEESSTPTAFFDGDSAGGSWVGGTGTPSKWEKPQSITIVDPDCPPVPDAPQPPFIELACPIDVDVWRRYFLSVPADKAGGWSNTATIVRLTTGASEVRDVRVRFYANPFGDNLEELDPCDYCGEFYISYIPSRTVMDINGITRTIMANVDGSGSTTAMNLVSNVDGGPISWPLLRCDIGYYMTIDISPTEVLDLDVRLAVARRA